MIRTSTQFTIHFALLIHTHASSQTARETEKLLLAEIFPNKSLSGLKFPLCKSPALSNVRTREIQMASSYTEKTTREAVFIPASI